MTDYRNEAEYKKAICSQLVAAGFDVQFHEDRLSNFIPDISLAGLGADGWIEVKYQHRVPGCLDSIKHYTKGQENWLRRRGVSGSGNCYLLLGTPNLHFLWRWDELQEARCLPIDPNSGVSSIPKLVATLAVLFCQTPGRG